MFISNKKYAVTYRSAVYFHPSAIAVVADHLGISVDSISVPFDTLPIVTYGSGYLTGPRPMESAKPTVLNSYATAIAAGYLCIEHTDLIEAGLAGSGFRAEREFEFVFDRLDCPLGSESWIRVFERWRRQRLSDAERLLRLAHIDSAIHRVARELKKQNGTLQGDRIQAVLQEEIENHSS